MRVICDAPGQTCNRLWTYVTSVACCVAEKRRMVIIFYDWTIEDFPNLLHCPFIYFPLWHKWYLERGNGWNNYKGLTWKVTHNKTWDKIFKMLGFKKGWYTMDDTRYLAQTKQELQHIFRPRKGITDRAEQMMSEIRKNSDLVVGIHIRHGDYKTFFNGRYYYTLGEYHQLMLRIQQVYQSQRVSFFISSNESFDVSIFEGCRCFRFGKEPSGDILDLHTLSLCDRILGPWSTYSRWASFIGEVPLCFIKSKDQQFTDESFSIVTDFYHFANGESTEDYWKPQQDMKLAILTSGILPIPAVQGGAVENLIDFYLEYNDLHKLHDITVYSVWHPDVEKSQVLKSDVNHYIYIKVNSIWGRIRKYLYQKTHKDGYYHYSIEFFLHEAIRHLKHQRYDVIILENRPEYILNIKEKINTKYVLHLHNDFLNVNTRNCNLIYREFNRIICISDFITKQVNAIAPNHAKGITLYNAINIKKFQNAERMDRDSLGLSMKDFVIVYSGRLNEEKGILQLILAIKQINMPDIRLLVVGASSYGKDKTPTPFIQQLQQESEPIKANIAFTGFVDYQEIPSYLKMADIAVVPSMWEEPFGLTVIEAMAVGLPLITTRSGGISEICEGVATIVDREDIVNNLAAAILDLYYHPDKREAMVKASLERSKQFSKEHYAEDFFKAIEL